MTYPISIKDSDSGLKKQAVKQTNKQTNEQKQKQN